jgi:hypothetical protein
MPGGRLNLSKSGVSASIGGSGASNSPYSSQSALCWVRNSPSSWTSQLSELSVRYGAWHFATLNGNWPEAALLGSLLNLAK